MGDRDAESKMTPDDGPLKANHLPHQRHLNCKVTYDERIVPF